MIAPPQLPEQASRVNTALDIIDKVTKIAAVFIGGAWAYLNYIRGRTYKKRLEVSISGEWLHSDGVSFLSGAAQLKNVGLSKVPIEQKGTAIVVYELRPSASTKSTADVIEERVKVRSVFKDHAWIEPGEPINEAFLLQLGLSKERVAMKLELRVVAANIEWNANCIVKPTQNAPASENKTNEGVKTVTEKSFPSTPESSNPVTTQINERKDITEEIEREKSGTLNDPGQQQDQKTFD